MIVRAIRLKNIKSYAEGPGGEGVTVHFQPGVNRIAGRNGHGKSTLIEALGYAMFGAAPPCLENFDLATYFLRAGARAAEIDITFSLGPETYRIERGLGPASRRRAKVVLVDDGSVCAEDEREVSAFLGRLLGFPDPGRLADVFLKLLGVKQGHLTRPFDAKPSQAKDFFEPLLDVEVFRQCFDRIKPAVDQFETEYRVRDRELAALEERIRERQDSPGNLAERAAAAEALALRRAGLEADLERLRLDQERLEARAAGLAQAQGLRQEARQDYDLLAQRRAQAAELAQAARDAAAALALLEPGHRAWLEAEAELGRLRQRQEHQRRLESRRAEAERQRAELDARAQAARERAELFTGQGAAKARESDLMRQRLEELQARLAPEQDARAAEQALAVLAPFGAGLRPAQARRERLLGQIRALEAETGAWDPAALADARDRADAAGRELQDRTLALTGLRERQRSLADQLREIGSGVCPFLKEQCRQFDPAKVQADLGLLAGRIAAEAAAAGSAGTGAETSRAALAVLERQAAALDGLRQQQADRTTELQEALQSLVPAAVPGAAASLARWPGVAPLPAWAPGEGLAARCAQAERYGQEVQAWWEEAETAARAALADRLRDQRDAANLVAQLAALASEAGSLSERAREEGERARDLDLQAAAAAAAVAGDAAALEAFATLESDLALQAGLLETHHPAYLDYLGRKPAADQLAAREAGLAACAAAERAADLLLTERTGELEALQRAFDPAALAAAAAAFQDRHAEAAACRADLQHAQEALLRAQERHREWAEASAGRDRLRAAMDRVKAAGDLGELARNVLKNAAPAVAQHLCTTIAGRAQAIFNLINPDPVELQWSSSRYSLRIIPGERRFAMLSGGEQTKLALAMTLAMIQEFSGLRFCIFDEPTYGVDAESRARLAEAILAARRAADLDQLLLVSHDDAFEGRVEHAVLLTRTAAGGTRPALED